MPDPLAGETVRAPDTAVGWRPGRALVRGNRTTNKTTISVEVGVCRLDNISITAGRLYMVVGMPARLDSATSTDRVTSRFRLNETGTATTASTQISFGENADQGSITLIGFFVASVTGTACSILYTVARPVGTGATTWLGQDHPNGWNMVVLDCGEDPGDSGIDI